MMRRICRTVLPLALLAPLFSAHTGGWATITVNDLPDYVVAQQQFSLAFKVRQHGHDALNDLTPVIEARAGKQLVNVNATRAKAPGEYTANITLPEPGEWRITIHSRFGPSSVNLLPLRATGAGALNAPTFTAAERGNRLFVAKGCLTCHVHQGVKESGLARVGPDLSQPRLANDYLAKFLADPSIRPPTTTFKMPNLELKPAEISALVAFLNQERK